MDRGRLGEAGETRATGWVGDRR